MDLEQGLIGPDDDQALRDLRAWLGGDEDAIAPRLESFADDELVELFTLRDSLRECVAVRRCLDPATVRGVPDLITHAAEHVDRLSDATVRAFGILLTVFGGCGCSHAGQPTPPTLDQPHSHSGAPMWAVDEFGRVGVVVGWVARPDWYDEIGPPVWSSIPIVALDGSTAGVEAVSGVAVYADEAEARHEAADRRREARLKAANRARPPRLASSATGDQQLPPPIE
jgi:hypothetical protein